MTWPKQLAAGYTFQTLQPWLPAFPQIVQELPRNPERSISLSVMPPGMRGASMPLSTWLGIGSYWRNCWKLLAAQKLECVPKPDFCCILHLFLRFRIWVTFVFSLVHRLMLLLTEPNRLGLYSLLPKCLALVYNRFLWNIPFIILLIFFHCFRQM